MFSESVVEVLLGPDKPVHRTDAADSLFQDPFDPRTWTEDNHEYRIYGDDGAHTWCVVDADDYFYFTQWKWCPKIDYIRGGGKLYLRRAVNVREGGQLIKTVSRYLHIEIMKRVEPEPPTSAHVIVDHRDGDSTNCRKINLRWATHRLNVLNRFGSHYYGELV